MILHALQNQWTAMPSLAFADFGRSEPDSANDVVVELTTRDRTAHAAAKREAQIGHVFVWALKSGQLDAEQSVGCELTAGFFQCFAYRAVHRTFAWLQMTSRVVQTQPLDRVFLHEQKAAVTLNDGGHRHAGFPDLAHA